MIVEVKNANFNQNIESGFRLPDDGIVTEVVDALFLLMRDLEQKCQKVLAICMRGLLQ